MTEDRCPVWCDGHTDLSHYSNEFLFEDGAPCGEHHGLVLTLVEPHHADQPLGRFGHGEPSWEPARLNVSLLQKMGALTPTVEVVVPKESFRLTVEEAERLRDALTDLLTDVDRDLKAWLEAHAGEEVPA